MCDFCIVNLSIFPTKMIGTVIYILYFTSLFGNISKLTRKQNKWYFEMKLLINQTSKYDKCEILL